MIGLETLGQSIPPDTAHAVSVSLPTWQSNVGYEENESWVVEKMTTGYPRFFIHKSILRLADAIVQRHGNPTTEKAMLFPTSPCASRCVEFLLRMNPSANAGSVRILHFVPQQDKVPSSGTAKYVQPRLSAVLYPAQLFPTAKSFWQHTGEGVSSRRAEFCHQAFDDGYMVEQGSLRHSPPRLLKGPRRYQRPLSTDHIAINAAKATTNGSHNKTSGATTTAVQSTTPATSSPSVEATDSTTEAGAPDSALFVEERFGRNLDVGFAAQAKLAIRRRIAGSLTKDVELPDSLDLPADTSRERNRDVPGFSEDDVYLYGGGMNAIYSAHRYLLSAVNSELKSIMYGFPYVDTLKVLEKFGPGALFYGFGSDAELDDLEARLERGERFLSLFCEFPGNPLLVSPDLVRIRRLADTYDFAVVVDETIGNFLNVHVLPYADIVVSSLTKVFSGDSNVMGGCLILNPRLRHYARLKAFLAHDFEDTHFAEDSVYLERNSRDFVPRIAQINRNAETLATLLASPRWSHVVKRTLYPYLNASRPHYDACRLPRGGYGGLLSTTFHRVSDARVFYDALEVHKGPSLGTNFTLASPFVLLAHYGELEWAESFGCERSLVRFSVGLEAERDLVRTFEVALEAVEAARREA